MKEKLKSIEGITLQTWPRGKEFSIVEITADRVIFKPKLGNGTCRWEYIDTIINAADKSWDSTELRQKIQEWHPNTRNSSYIAAIVRAIR